MTIEECETFLRKEIAPKFPLGIRLLSTKGKVIIDNAYFESQIGRLKDGRLMSFLINRIGNIYGFRYCPSLLNSKRKVKKVFLDNAEWLDKKGLK